MIVEIVFEVKSIFNRQHSNNNNELNHHYIITNLNDIFWMILDTVPVRKILRPKTKQIAQKILLFFNFFDF